MAKTTILIVEDEAIIAADLASNLRALGYEVAATTTRGDEAVALAKDRRPDLVLMDIQLAGPVDGVQAAESIRQQCDLPVIYLTAHSDSATLKRARITEPFGYILKPFERRDLETNVEMALYRHRVDRQLREQREWLRVTLASIGDAVITSDTAGRVTFLNPVAAVLTGWPEPDAIGQQVQRVFQTAGDNSSQPAEDIVARVLREGRIVALANDSVLIARDGREIPIEDSAAPIRDGMGRIIGVVLVFHDVTERRRAQEQLLKLNRTLRALSNSSQALMREEEEEDLLQQVCQIIVGDCGHAMAWIGLAENDEARSVRPAAHAGFEAGYLGTLRLTWADTERGRGPTGTAIRTGKPCVCQNMHTDPRFAPWREEAIRRGYASSLVLPLLADGKAFGAISIYSEVPERFSQDEVNLLTELAGDLAQGIQTLRLRKAHRLDEAALRQAKDDWERTFDAVPDLIAILDNHQHIVRANHAMASRLGMSPEQCIGKLCYAAVHNTNGPPAVCPHRQTMADGQEHLVELTEPRLCGDFLVSTTPLRDATGAIVGSVHVARDITARKRVEADLKVSNRRLDLLAETADALLKTDAPQAAIAAQGRKLLDFLGCDVFFNFVAEEGRPDLRLNAHAGIPAEDMQQVRCTDCGVIIDGQATQSACPNFPRTPVSADGSKPAGGPTFGVEAYACHPLVAYGRTIGTLFFGTRRRREFKDDELAVMRIVADQFAIAVARKRADDALRLARDQLEQKVRERTAELLATNNALQSEMAERQSLEARVLDVSQAEQRRLGQELHDGLCQQLAGIAYLCNVTQDRLAKIAPGEAAGVARVIRLIQDANTQAHGLARGLDPIGPGEAGLIPAFRGLIANLKKYRPIATRFECPEPVAIPDNTVATHLYRIAQEALNNAAKHSEATRITLRLATAPDGLVLAVKDNGHGFSAPRSPSDSMGMEIMRYRARTIGATLDIDSDPKRGTVLTCTLPLKCALPAAPSPPTPASP